MTPQQRAALERIWRNAEACEPGAVEALLAWREASEEHRRTTLLGYSDSAFHELG